VSREPLKACRSTSSWAFSPFNRVFRNKHQAVSQGVRRFGKRSIFIDM
jgi:hypothetical protein